MKSNPSTMDSVYDFDAPQFIDLRDTEPENLENYFNVEAKGNAPEFVSSSDDISRRVAFATEEKENVLHAGKNPSLGGRVKTPGAKKSLSMLTQTHIDENLLDKISNLQIDSAKKRSPARQPLRATQVFEGITLLPVSEKKHKMITRADIRTPLLKLRNRSLSRNIEISDDETDDSMVSAVSSSSQIEPVYQPQPPAQRNTYAYLKRNSAQFSPLDVQTEAQPSKFIALAEQVANFHKETPDRYRTRPHQPWRPSQVKPVWLGIPKGPKLTTMRRSRPVHFPDRQQREQQEYDEMLKHQIKAHPVNAKILRQVSLGLKAPIAKRPTTCPMPFNLTYHKPKPVEEAPVFQFKAQPVPRKILQSPVGIPPKKIIPPTTPKTPAITLPAKKAIPCNLPVRKEGSVHGSTDSLPRNTTIEPFSFDQRDQFMLARKEENIKKVLEEEKKTFSCFKAQRVPVGPTLPLKCRVETKKATTPMPFNLTKTKPVSERCQAEEKMEPFKAKPATVLTTRPFFPSYGNHATPKVQEFQFKTRDRLPERMKFAEKLQQAVEQAKKLEEQEREENEKRARDEVKELRKMAEFKANPIPRNTPFEVHASHAKLTQPLSPCFRSGKQPNK